MLCILQGVQRNRRSAMQLLTLTVARTATLSGGGRSDRPAHRGDPGSAICVQRLDDSLNSAIHTRYRSLLRSSSMHEPRDPPSEVVKFFNQHTTPTYHTKCHKGSQKKPKMREVALRPGGRCDADSHRFKCGIQLNAGGTPPTISHLQLPVHGVSPSPRRGDNG